MTPAQYAQDKAAASGSSFYYAFLFLPPQKRAAITAFYAFCREIDDVVDEVSDPAVAQTKLGWWQLQVRQLYAQDRSDHPALQALQPHLQTCGIQEHALMHVIEGCEMDLHQNRYLDFAQLAHYCHLVAGVVGEVAARIFGHTDARTLQYADRLGRALQLTNIVRDVGEDAVRGRVYLPIEDLQRFNVKAHEIIQRGAQSGPDFAERFAALMRFQIARAQRTYDEALALLPDADRQSQKPGLMMASIYRALLARIEREPQAVLHQRVSLAPLHKLWLAWKMQALGRF